jgi:excisionase family DNA binding protein
MDCALLSINELGRFLGVGETTAKLLVRRGEVISVKIGDRRLVPRAAAQAYVDRLVAEATGEHELATV